MFHFIWYILIGLISGVIAKSVMHVHMTIFWTIVLGIIGSIIGGAVTHMFSRPTNERYHPAGLGCVEGATWRVRAARTWGTSETRFESFISERGVLVVTCYAGAPMVLYTQPSRLRLAAESTSWSLFRAGSRHSRAADRGSRGSGELSSMLIVMLADELPFA
jgi:uncharacterized membrane protein YeaQ/YmgE (transglycosylase-associated protein family)